MGRPAQTGTGLTPPLIAAVQHAADGLDVWESAKECNITYAGVRRRRARAMERLGADTMIQAVAMAIRRGIIK